VVGGAIEAVLVGMTVVDAAGERIGTVGFVRMGDPDAATVWADEPPSAAGLVGQVLDAFRIEEPDVPEPLRSRLIQAGYVKVDGPGLTGADRYVRADQIAAVEGDTLRPGAQRTSCRSSSARAASRAAQQPRGAGRTNSP
jgi:hypothetical protein